MKQWAVFLLFAAALPGNTNAATFVGNQSCTACHGQQAASWRGSHHDMAMALPDEATVRGDFDDALFEDVRFWRRGDDWLITAPGPKGDPADFVVAYTFGWEPLQQYLLDIGDGKLQAFDIAWDTEAGKWFRLHERKAPGDWLHWTGGAMNWNTMCADCHSTNLEINFDPENEAFDTRFSNIDVSCEACHGPGSDHVTFMATPGASSASIERIRADLHLTGSATVHEVIGQCASCHARREKLSERNPHDGDFHDHYGATLPHPPEYFADGQIRDEVYVYGSFLQSRMYTEGVGCTDCHDPHSLTLKASIDDNALCLQCHEPRYNDPKHHFHAADVARCVDCHMPGRTYMGNDFRRDHSFRPPRPDLTVSTGVPNACNDCHEDKTARWTSEHVVRWYGTARSDHPGEILATAAPGHVGDLVELAMDNARPVMARAAAIWHLSRMPSHVSGGTFIELASDPEPLVRKAVAHALAALPGQAARTALYRLLSDPNRSVRIAAIEPLADQRTGDLPPAYRSDFETALEEYKTYLAVNRYFPAGSMNRGNFFWRTGQPRLAEEAWRETLSRDPAFSPARVNLASLLSGQGRRDEAIRQLREGVAHAPGDGSLHYSLALLQAEAGRLDQALSHLEEAASLSPENPRIHYNLAVARQQAGDASGAESAYLQAIERSPNDPEFRYGISTLYLQQGNPAAARPHVEWLAERQPGHPAVLQLQELLNRQATE